MTGRMRLISCGAAALIGLTSTANGEATSSTGFRFLSLGIPKAQLEKAQTDFQREERDGAILFKSKNEECARALIGPDEKVAALTLEPCFFVADGMKIDDFAEKFSKAYKLQNLKTVSEQSGYISTRGYRGETSSSEDVTILQTGTPDVKGGTFWRDGFRVTIKPAIVPQF